jgi:hypothetical protein
LNIEFLRIDKKGKKSDEEFIKIFSCFVIAFDDHWFLVYTLEGVGPARSPGLPPMPGFTANMPPAPLGPDILKRAPRSPGLPPMPGLTAKCRLLRWSQPGLTNEQGIHKRRLNSVLPKATSGLTGWIERSP